MTDIREIIQIFLTSQMLCVVSTVNADGTPESALVAFSESSDLEITIGTFNDTRKFANILRNPHVACVIGTTDQTLQLEGIARIANDEEIDHCRIQHTQKNPASAKYVHDPKQRFVIVKPTWLRYTDYGTDPDTIEERRF